MDEQSPGTGTPRHHGTSCIMIANESTVRKDTNVLCEGGHRERSMERCKVRKSWRELAMGLVNWMG